MNIMGIRYDGSKMRQILDEHHLWVKSNGREGQRADFHGADLSYANLCDADLLGIDLSGANLYRANLYNTKLSYANLLGANLLDANLIKADFDEAILPYPIYQFCAGRELAVATPHRLQIGCRILPWEYWLDPIYRKKLADDSHFSDAEYEVYSELIITFHKLLVK